MSSPPHVTTYFRRQHCAYVRSCSSARRRLKAWLHAQLHHRHLRRVQLHVGRILAAARAGKLRYALCQGVHCGDLFLLFLSLRAPYPRRSTAPCSSNSSSPRPPNVSPGGACEPYLSPERAFNVQRLVLDNASRVMCGMPRGTVGAQVGA